MATIEYLGKQSLGGTMPTGLAATLSALAALEAQLPGVALKASASVGVELPIPITDLIENIRKLIEALAALSASGVLVLPPSINASLTVDLDAQAAAISASIALQASLAALYGTPGFYAYYYNGACNLAGGKLSEAIGSGLPDVGMPSQEVAGLYIICSEGPAIAALRSLAGI
jgi:muconolactone delta-isomerase